MTKLNLFNKNLFSYNKVIFLDGDLYPLKYFDSLFSYNSPAGWLEHARIKLQDHPIYEWSRDRAKFMNNISGSLLPDILTNLKASQAASDINASIYVLEPSIMEYNDIIKELTDNNDSSTNTYFGPGKKYDGYYIGNRKRNNYGLPEQNYLTQRYSGKWHGICFGYESWLIDIENAFGIHFAAFRIKPWNMQIIGNRFTINKNSQLSKTHNIPNCNRTYGMKVFNILLFEFLKNTDNNNYFSNYLNNSIKFYARPFDPWEPEYNVHISGNYVKINNLTYKNLQVMTREQLQLVTFLNDRLKKSKKSMELVELVETDDKVVNLLKKKLIYDEYYKHAYDPLFLAICYLIYKEIALIINNYNSIVDEKDKIITFTEGGTLLGTYRNNGFLIWDDDMDIGVYGNDEIEADNKIFKILELALTNGFCCYAHIRKDSTRKFADNNVITRRIILDLDNDTHCNNTIKLSYFSNSKNLKELMFINVSISEEIYLNILKTNGLEVPDDHYTNSYSSSIFLKIPWVDFLPYSGKIHREVECEKKYIKFRKGGTPRQMNDNFLGISENELFPLQKATFIDCDIFIPKNPILYAYYLWNDFYLWKSIGEPVLNLFPNNLSPISNILIFNRHGNSKKKRALKLSINDTKIIDKCFNDKIKSYVNKIGSIKLIMDRNVNFIKKFLGNS